jgi:tRNA (guanine-N7-)-methyltransferase
VVLPKERWVRTRVPLGDPHTPFDWTAVFGRDAPRVLDLGCGNGYWLVHSGLARPEVDHLGVELVPPALRLGSLRAGQRGLSHVKFAWGDATEFLLERCPAASVDEVHLYHPQPYYEARRIVRRQLTPEVLGAIHRVLRPGGSFVFQTDNPAYMAYARRIAPALFDFRERHTPWEDLPGGRTLREIVARGQGLTIERAVARPLELDLPERARRVAELPLPEFDANKPGHGPQAPRRAGRKRPARGGKRGR